MEYLEQRENDENEQKGADQDNPCKQQRLSKQFPDIGGDPLQIGDKPPGFLHGCRYLKKAKKGRGGVAPPSPPGGYLPIV
jgi:hypothetical protein